MVPSPHEHGLTPEHLDSLQHAINNFDFHSFSSVLLSDAADAVADAVAEDDGGLWRQWLNVFRNGLDFAHSKLDGPLRNAGFENTWGMSIFLFTASVRSLLIPLSIQQSKSTEYVKALKPYQDEIKEKFKDNEDLKNRATAKLFEDSGTNPLSGCLFSLAQIPVFLGLYRGITLLAKEGKIDEPFLWIPTLAGPVSPPTYRGLEWLTEGWTFPEGSIPVPQLGWETTLAFLVMPVVLVLGQKLTMTVLSPDSDTSKMSDEEREQFERSQGILKFLPLLIGFFSLQVPAGLTIYWFTSNFFTLSQSLAVRQYYKANPPKIELPDYWDALENMEEMTPEEKRKAAKAGIATGPKFEDLIDEAKFHFVVERNPLRENSKAWERVTSSGDKRVIPTEMEAWVNGGNVVEAETLEINGTEEKEAALQ